MSEGSVLSGPLWVLGISVSQNLEQEMGAPGTGREMMKLGVLIQEKVKEMYYGT